MAQNRMAQLPRGIAPDLLLSQVKNTMPYLFDAGVEGTDLGRFPPARILRSYAAGTPLSHFEYFRLCMSSHLLTCATPVPTDVDNQIRQKLWPKQLPVETAIEMASLVLESRSWDFTQVSSRASHGLSGHLGEWFTLAAGAYGALKQYADPAAAIKRQEVFDAIADEVNHHSEVFGTLWREKDGVGCLIASASIAHNFGDLDRVMDMWDLSVGDPLRLSFYKLGITPFDTERKLRYLGRLWVAGELYKSTIDGSSMALENHRHYALRKIKDLRLSRDLRVPLGPFFDNWGKRVAGFLGEERTVEVADALARAWDRQPKSLAYGRGLRGMLEVFPKLPVPEIERAHDLRTAINTPQDRFEKKWNDEALRLMDDIPSRA